MDPNNPEVVKPDDDIFANAFSDFATPEGDNGLSQAQADDKTARALADATPAVEKPAAEVPVVPAAGDDAGLPDPATVPAGGDTPPVVDGGPAKQSSAEDAAVLERFKSIVKDAVSPPPVEQPKPTPAQQAEPFTPYTAEEAQIVQAYVTDYPDVARAEQLIRRRDYQALTGYIFQQLTPVLQNLMGTTQQINQEKHVNQLYEKVTDYDDVRDKVVTWVDEQPAYLKAAFKQVIAKGTPEEVVDLINRWRTSAGVATPVVAGTVPAAPAAKPALAAATQRAVKALAPVSSKRSGVAVDGVDPNNFDAAFAAFAVPD